MCTSEPMQEGRQDAAHDMAEKELQHQPGS